jgi:long-subunit fatty acid transport protein
MKLTNRTFLMLALLFASAAGNVMAAEDESRWSFSQRFQGTSNAAGLILKTNSTAIYSFNDYVKAYGGFPVYFARATSSSGTSQFVNGLGNVFSGLVVTAGSANSIYYSSNLLSTLPTGDASRGFSTGHPTIDWTNTFSHSVGTLTPFVSIGVANTISDTSFFVRPFSSKGIVSHFEVGAIGRIARNVSVGASLYGVRAAGEQQIDSKVVENEPPASSHQQSSPTQGGVLQSIGKRTGLADGRRVPPVFQTQQQTVGPASVANDEGLSTWVSLRPNPTTDFQIGYSRSMGYQLNSLFFGVGFRFGHPVSVVN